MAQPPKQVIVLRKFPSLRTGKYCAQAAHASELALFNSGTKEEAPDHTTFRFTDPEVTDWINNKKFTKICVSVKTEEELLALEAAAIKAGLPTGLIQDCGATEFKGVPTYTALGIGPAAPERIDPITRHLPLF